MIARLQGFFRRLIGAVSVDEARSYYSFVTMCETLAARVDELEAARSATQTRALSYPVGAYIRGDGAGFAESKPAPKPAKKPAKAPLKKSPKKRTGRTH